MAILGSHNPLAATFGILGNLQLNLLLLLHVLKSYIVELLVDHKFIPSNACSEYTITNTYVIFSFSILQETSFPSWYTWLRRKYTIHSLYQISSFCLNIIRFDFPLNEFSGERFRKSTKRNPPRVSNLYLTWWHYSALPFGCSMHHSTSNTPF